MCSFSSFHFYVLIDLSCLFFFVNLFSVKADFTFLFQYFEGYAIKYTNDRNYVIKIMHNTSDTNGCSEIYGRMYRIYKTISNTHLSALYT